MPDDKTISEDSPTPSVSASQEESARVPGHFSEILAEVAQRATVAPTDTSWSEVINTLAGTNARTPLWAARNLVLSLDPQRMTKPSPDLEHQVSDLQVEITKLRAEVTEKARSLEAREVESAYKDGYIIGLTEQLTELNKKQALAHLLDRVSQQAQQKLFESESLRSSFERDDACLAYVLSIDIRRSTELMLKARTPRLFAEFIVGLAQALRGIVLANHGVFDKFTGDGVLAFFPEFFSGVDAGYFALRAATQAHQLFKTHYDSNRNCFVAVLRDTGLGIGIDYGLVNVVHIGSEFTVVGTPVVYACRMAGAMAGMTYVNQPAYEKIAEKYSAIASLVTTEIDVKNEGSMLAYSAALNAKPFDAAQPDWLTETAAG